MFALSDCSRLISLHSIKTNFKPLYDYSETLELSWNNEPI